METVVEGAGRGSVAGEGRDEGAVNAGISPRKLARAGRPLQRPGFQDLLRRRGPRLCPVRMNSRP
jgi:hypothetical protein